MNGTGIVPAAHGEHTMSDTATSPAVSYAGRDFDIASLPQTSLVSLVRKGLAHFLGNEQASKVTAWKATMTEAGTPPDDAAIAAKKAEFVEAAVTAVLEGTVGVQSARGPRATPVDAVARRMAEAQMKVNLGKLNPPLAMPKGDATITLKAADGTESTFTRVQLIERRLAHPTHGPAIRKAAEKEVAALAKQAAAEVSAEGVDALDL
jgi:hypothetical protein